MNRLSVIWNSLAQRETETVKTKLTKSSLTAQTPKGQFGQEQ
jgi:hypothetical protein